MDSRGISLLQGLLVLKAAELAEIGKRPAEIVAELNRIRAQSGIFLTVDTFERLLASGRVEKEQAFFGKLFNLKPILALDIDGKVITKGKVLGRKRVLTKILNLLAEEIGAYPQKIRFGISHVGAPHIIPDVRERLIQIYGDVEILSAPATPVISTHLGTGAWALAYMMED